MRLDKQPDFPKGTRIYEFRALTDIWTGDASGQGGHLKTTGLLGSIRWWYEVVVRGLGGFACNAGSENPKEKCSGFSEDDSRGNSREKKHCVVCEFFGTTGWARKFRFEVYDRSWNIFGSVPLTTKIKDKADKEGINSSIVVKSPSCWFKTGSIPPDALFHMVFIPLRHIDEKEWCLLDLTLRFIARYGAIGGKTVYKPSNEEKRENEEHHKDYGLIKLLNPSDLMPECRSLGPDSLGQYVQDEKWRKDDSAEWEWASLTNFWFVEGKYLYRYSKHHSIYNRVLRRKEYKWKAKEMEDGAEGFDNWLAGVEDKGEGKKPENASKKVFSFKEPPRTFGFVRSQDEFKEIEIRLNDIKAYLDEITKDSEGIKENFLTQAADWRRNDWIIEKGVDLLDKVWQGPSTNGGKQ